MITRDLGMKINEHQQMDSFLLSTSLQKEFLKNSLSAAPTCNIIIQNAGQQGIKLKSQDLSRFFEQTQTQNLHSKGSIYSKTTFTI